MSFDGYSPAALEFLAALPSRDQAWFKANRSSYEDLIVGPTKSFVAELGDRLQEVRPAIVAEPKTNGSIAPINNDLRFSPDKAPYKDHLLLRFWEGSPKKTAPTLFVRIGPSEVGFATGVVPAAVDNWRRVVDGPDGARLDAAIDTLAGERGAEVAGQELKRVPAPFPPDHRHAGLLRHKMLQVRWVEPAPPSIGHAAFVEWCFERIMAGMPLHSVLVEAFR